MEQVDLVNNGLYSCGKARYRYNSSSHTLIPLNGGACVVVTPGVLVTLNPISISRAFLLANGFTEENDDTSMGENVLYKYKEHGWLTIEDSGRNKYHVSVGGGIALFDIKYLHEVQNLFTLLKINKKTTI